MESTSTDPLKSTRLFSDLNLEERALLVARAQRRTFAAGDVILSAGNSNRSLFVVVQGEAEVRRDATERDLPVARLGPAAFFGEMSFLDDTAASASVVARSEVEVLELSGQVMKEMLSERPGLAARIYRNLAVELRDRLVRTSEMLDQYVDLSDVLRGNPGAHEMLGYS